MNEPAPNRIAHFRKLRKLSQQQLADAVGGVHWITISKLERGKIKLTEEWLKKLSAALKVNEIDIFITERPYRQIFVDGMVFPGGEIGYEKEDEQNFVTEVEIETGNSGVGFWFCVIGNAMSPYFHEGDLIRTSIFEGIGPDECIGRLAHVVIKGSRINQYIGIIEKSNKPGRYNLKRASGPMLKDVEVESANLVTQAVFRGADIAENG